MQLWIILLLKQSEQNTWTEIGILFCSMHTQKWDLQKVWKCILNKHVLKCYRHLHGVQLPAYHLGQRANPTSWETFCKLPRFLSTSQTYSLPHKHTHTSAVNLRSHDFLKIVFWALLTFLPLALSYLFFTIVAWKQRACWFYYHCIFSS